MIRNEKARWTLKGVDPVSEIFQTYIHRLLLARLHPVEPSLWKSVHDPGAHVFYCAVSDCVLWGLTALMRDATQHLLLLLDGNLVLAELPKDNV